MLRSRHRELQLFMSFIQVLDNIIGFIDVYGPSFILLARIHAVINDDYVHIGIITAM